MQHFSGFTVIHTKTPRKSALGAALVDLWGEDLGLNTHLMVGLRDLAARAEKEPLAAAVQLELSILDAKKAKTSGSDLIKAQVVAALLPFILPSRCCSRILDCGHSPRLGSLCEVVGHEGR